jgi:GAF domain-containing protein
MRLRHASVAGLPTNIDANDDVVIQLRHTHTVLDLADRNYALPGALAFPIMVRGQPKGILLLGEKRAGHHYRPDEVALLKTTASQLGLDQESLRVEKLETDTVLLHQDVIVYQRQLQEFRQIITARVHGADNAVI